MRCRDHGCWVRLLAIGAGLVLACACRDPNSAEARQDFLAAIDEEQVATVRRWLDAGLDPNLEPALPCEAPLAMASVRGSVEIAVLLLQRGARVNAAAGPDGRTALHCASGPDDEVPEVVDLLLQQGADPNLRDENGETPLMLAASRGHVETIRLLVGARAELDGRSAAGKTAAELAREAGHTEVVRLLKASGARVEVPGAPVDDQPVDPGLASLSTSGGTISLGETWDDVQPKVEGGQHIDTFHQSPTRSVQTVRLDGMVYRLTFERAGTGPHKLVRIDVQ